MERRTDALHGVNARRQDPEYRLAMERINLALMDNTYFESLIGEIRHFLHDIKGGVIGHP